MSATSPPALSRRPTGSPATCPSSGWRRRCRRRWRWPGAILVALIKPQFEAGPGAVGKGGILRDAAAHAGIRAGIAAFLTARGWGVTHEGESPITGADGNREFLIAARAP